MPVIAQIQLRRGTAAAWTSANPVLAAGEAGFETDTGKLKIGDGATAWTSLPYVVGGSGLSAYTHTQGSASDTWTINHNLGRKVGVTLFTVGGIQMLADVSHPSNNQAVATFVSAVAGSAHVV